MRSARDWLTEKYGVDLTGVSDAEVVARAAAILGVRCDGEAATATLVALRVDAEWNEEDHPRAADGKFGGGGGGGDRQARAEALSGQAYAASSKAKGSGSAADHEAAQQAHGAALLEHRAIGNGTAMREHGRAMEAHQDEVVRQIGGRYNPQTGEHQPTSQSGKLGGGSAADKTRGGASSEEIQRGWADKAKASGEKGPLGRTLADQIAGGNLGRLADKAKKAHESGDHQAAAKAFATLASARGAVGDHLGAAYASNRAAEHTAATTPSTSSPQHVHADTHAANAASFAATAKSAASGTSPAARASARKAAESAALAKVAAEHGDHAGARQHAEAAGRHMQAAQQKASEHSTRVNPPASAPVKSPSQKATDLTTTAFKASTIANRDNSVSAHQAAFDAHGAALVAHRSLGNTAQMNEHGRAMDAHEYKAGKKFS